MHLKCKIYLNIFILYSIGLSNPSYEGLLLPSLAIEVNDIQSYHVDKNIIFNLDYSNYLTSSLIVLPNDIHINSIHYYYDIFKYSAVTNFSIINYGNFIDSENNYKFKAKDIILKNQLIYKVQDYLYLAGALKYMHSKLDFYKSNIIIFDVGSYYFKSNFLFNFSLNNLGLVLNSYTNYLEKLPLYYNVKISYNLSNTNLLMVCNYKSFSNYNEFNFNNQLFINERLSLSLGYTTLAKKLYYGDFDNDFLIGFNIGTSFIYSDYVIDFGIKNLGPTGLINALSISKSFN